MLRGINTSAAGLLSDERMQQVLSNNLANTETPGFKMSIGELMAYPEQKIQADGYNSMTTGPNVGKMGLGVLYQEGVPLFTAGQLSQTGRSLDIGIADNTPTGTYALVQTAANQAGQAGAGNAGANGTGANAAGGANGTGANAAGGANGAGTAAAGAPTGVSGVNGTITAAGNGQLGINGQPLAVVDVAGKPIAGMYAIKNPAYTGTALVGADGKPVYDANGAPSYVFANAAGNVLGTPGDSSVTNASVRVGQSTDMGMHSFLPVSFTAYDGTTGIAVTRDGSMSVNAQQQVVDANGSPVLPVGANGLPIPNGRIVVNPAYQGTTLFNNDGSSVTDPLGNPSYFVQTANGQQTQGRLGLVDADISNLQPTGEGEFMVGQTFQPNTVLTYLKAGTGTMSPGELEQSNVDTTAMMTQMLTVMASYQANQRVMQEENTELTKAVQDVGRVNL